MAHKLQSRLAKRLLSSPGTQAILSWIGAIYIKFVYLTCRWQLIGGEHPKALWESQQPFITAFWHGRILLMPRAWRGGGSLSMLISEHRDGRLIARVIRRFGMKTIVGSSSTGGSGALRCILRQLKAGESVGITPDGPQGPRMRVSEGFVDIARLAGVPVLLATLSVRRGHLLKTWDRFLFALPFTRGVISWSAPITVERHSDRLALETTRRQVETCLNEMTAAADRLCGREPLQPAPVDASAGPA